MCVCVCVCECTLSHVWLFGIPWTIACQAPLSMKFPRQEYWSGLPLPFPGVLPKAGIKPINRDLITFTSQSEVGSLRVRKRIPLGGSMWAKHFINSNGEGNGNPLQCSCLENPRDGGAWWAADFGAAQSQTRLKRLSSDLASTAAART